MAKDLYKIIGVSRTSTPEEIKKAYRQLAKKYHPDVNKGNKEAEDKFKEISAAYDILGDADHRKKYDQFGDMGQQGFDPRQQAYRQWSSTGGAGAGGPGSAEFDLGDIFGDLFGMGKRTGRSRRGATGWYDTEQEAGARSSDVNATVEIGFIDAVKGTERRLTIDHGRRQEKIDVKIPAGIRDGGKIRVAGKGEQGGDLYIQVKVAPHPQFWRENDDLYLEIPVTITEAALGATVRVPTLDAAVNLKIPAGTSSGQKMRLAGKGVVHLGEKGQGDQYVVIKIVVPPDLDETAKELLRQVAARSSFSPREK